jgi:hypothetical protein
MSRAEKKSPVIYTHAGYKPAFQQGKKRYYELLQMCFVIKDTDILLDNNVMLCKYSYREMKHGEVWILSSLLRLTRARIAQVV